MLITLLIVFRIVFLAAALVIAALHGCGVICKLLKILGNRRCLSLLAPPAYLNPLLCLNVFALIQNQDQTATLNAGALLELLGAVK